MTDKQLLADIKYECGLMVHELNQMELSGYLIIVQQRLKSVVEQLSKHGIKVPPDVRGMCFVCECDGCKKSLTSVDAKFIVKGTNELLCEKCRETGCKHD